MSLAPPTVDTSHISARIAAIRQRFEPARTSGPTTTLDARSAFDGIMQAAVNQGASGWQDVLDTTARADGGPVGDAAVDTAMQYLGVPYLWGGTDPDVGLDCSGFVQLVYRSLGVELPRVSRDQATAGVAVPSIEDARPGDLIAFGEPVDHIAIYVGDGKIIHAPRSGDVVKVTDIHRTPTAIRRIETGPASLDAAGSAATPLATLGALRATTTGSSVTGVAILRDPAVARYAPLFEQAGARHGVDPALLAAVAKVESNGNPDAVSSAGARGLMQFMPATAHGYGIDPLDPAQAVDAAARMLNEQRAALGTLELALAAYNAGPGAVRRHGGIPPYPETRNYVRKVMSHLTGAS